MVDSRSGRDRRSRTASEVIGPEAQMSCMTSRSRSPSSVDFSFMWWVSHSCTVIPSMLHVVTYRSAGHKRDRYSRGHRALQPTPIVTVYARIGVHPTTVAAARDTAGSGQPTRDRSVGEPGSG